MKKQSERDSTPSPNASHAFRVKKSVFHSIKPFYETNSKEINYFFLSCHIISLSI